VLRVHWKDGVFGPRLAFIGWVVKQQRTPETIHGREMLGPIYPGKIVEDGSEQWVAVYLFVEGVDEQFYVVLSGDVVLPFCHECSIGWMSRGCEEREGTLRIYNNGSRDHIPQQVRGYSAPTAAAATFFFLLCSFFSLAGVMVGSTGVALVVGRYFASFDLMSANSGLAATLVHSRGSCFSL
jgi:hypothetical protein